MCIFSGSLFVQAVLCPTLILIHRMPLSTHLLLATDATDATAADTPKKPVDKRTWRRDGNMIAAKQDHIFLTT